MKCRYPLTLLQIDQWPLRVAWRWDVICRWAICHRCRQCRLNYDMDNGKWKWDRKTMRQYCVIWSDRRIGGYMVPPETCSIEERSRAERMLDEKEKWRATMEQFAYRMGCGYESTDMDGIGVLLLTPGRLRAYQQEDHR